MSKSVFTAVFLGISLLGIYFFSQQPSPSPAFEPSEARADIQHALQREGREAAYESFKRAYVNVSFDTQHNAAHIFGESLYEAYGIDGVRTCGSEFNFGCYHGFFTRAVAAEGLPVIGELDRACDASLRPTACQHGIGHGILEYMGHTRLTDALIACNRTNQPDPLAGCTSGVFMEYNVPLSEDAGSFSVQSRPLDNPAEPYHPCTELSEEFRLSCFHELPQWWAQVYGRDFAKLGAFCAEAPFPDADRACFNGLGNIIASFGDYQAPVVAEMCGQIANPKGREECLINAAWSAYLERNDPKGADAICAGLPENLQAQCPK